MGNQKGYIPWNKGKKGVQIVSKETRIKIGEKSKGNTNTLGKHWKVINRKGVKKSEHTKKLIKFANTGKHYSHKTEYKKGENHPNWKGGITSINQRIRTSVQYKLWKKVVLERDKFTCIWCGTKDKTLHVDHIKPFSLYPELRFAIDNGRTLCIDCHKTTETYCVRKHK